MKKNAIWMFLDIQEIKKCNIIYLGICVSLLAMNKLAACVELQSVQQKKKLGVVGELQETKQ